MAVLTAEAGGKRVGCRVTGCWQTGAQRMAVTRGRYLGYLDVDDDLGTLPRYDAAGLDQSRRKENVPYNCDRNTPSR